MNKVLNEIDELKQTAFQIKKNDISNIDISKEIRDELINQDLRRYYYKLGIQK